MRRATPLRSPFVIVGTVLAALLVDQPTVAQRFRPPPVRPVEVPGARRGTAERGAGGPTGQGITEPLTDEVKLEGPRTAETPAIRLEKPREFRESVAHEQSRPLLAWEAIGAASRVLKPAIVAVVPLGELAYERVFERPQSASAKAEMQEQHARFQDLDSQLLSEAQDGKARLLEFIQSHPEAHPLILVGHSVEVGGEGGRSVRLPDGTSISEQEVHRMGRDNGVQCMVLTCHGEAFGLHGEISLAEASAICTYCLAKIQDPSAAPINDLGDFIYLVREKRNELDARGVAISAQAVRRIDGKDYQVLYSDWLTREHWVWFTFGYLGCAYVLAGFSVWQTESWSIQRENEAPARLPEDLVPLATGELRRRRGQQWLILAVGLIVVLMAAGQLTFEKWSGLWPSFDSESWVIVFGGSVSIGIAGFAFVQAREFTEGSLWERLCRATAGAIFGAPVTGVNLGFAWGLLFVGSAFVGSLFVFERTDPLWKYVEAGFVCGFMVGSVVGLWNGWKNGWAGSRPLHFYVREDFFCLPIRWTRILTLRTISALTGRKWAPASGSELGPDDGARGAEVSPERWQEDEHAARQPPSASEEAANWERSFGERVGIRLPWAPEAWDHPGKLARTCGLSALDEGFSERWRRLVSIVERGGMSESLIRGAFGLLVVAEEPLTYDTLMTFLQKATGRSVGFLDVAGLRERLAELLGSCRDCFVQAEQEWTEAGPYRFADPHFAGSVRCQLTEAEREDCHRLLAQGCLAWEALEGEAHLYALRHLPTHLRAAQEREAMRGLVQGDFFDQVILNVGPLAALAGLREVAEGLGKDAIANGRSLRDCTYRYCALAGELRGRAGFLEEMVAQGEMIPLLEFLQCDADPVRRGAFLIMLAALVRGHDDGQLSRELERTGVALAGPQLTNASDRVAGYSGPTTLLAYTLVAQAVAAIESNARPADDHPSFAEEGVSKTSDCARLVWDRAHVRPLTDVPWIWRLLGFVSGTSDSWMGIGFVLLLSGLILGGLVLSLAERTGWGMGLGRAIMAGYAAGGLACLLGWLAAYPVVQLLKLPPVSGRLTRIMSGLVQGMKESEAVGRRRILLSGARFASRWGERPMPASWQVDLAWLVEDGFASLTEDSRAVAGVILDVAAVGEVPCDAVISQLRRLECEPREAILKEVVAAFLARREHGSRVFRMLAETVRSTSDPALLLDFLTGYTPSASAPEAVKQDPLLQAATALSVMPPRALRKALQASFHRDEVAACSPIHVRFWRLAIGPLKHWLEVNPRLSRLLALPFMIAFGGLMLFLSVLLAAIMFPCFRRYDPYRVGRAAGGSGMGLRRCLAQLLHQTVNGSPEDQSEILPRGGWPLAPVAMRRLRDVVLAQAILRRDTYVWVLLGTKPDFARVLKRLVRERLISRTQVVLGVMSDRRLLDGVMASGRVPGAPRLVRMIEEGRDDRELRRVVPIRPAWLNLILIGALGLVGTLLYLGSLARSAPQSVGAWIANYVLWEALGICMGFPLIEHLVSWSNAHRMTPSSFQDEPGRSRKFPGRLAHWLILKARAWAQILIIFGAFLSTSAVFMIHIFLLEKAERARFILHRPAPGLDGLLFVALPLLLVLLVAPELMARWRGAHLLYPTARRLWTARFLWATFAITLCFLFTWISRLLT